MLKNNGFTKLPNEFLEHLAKIRLSGEESQLLYVIIRKTWGFQKKEDSISLSQFAELTGINKPNICRAINRLLSKKIIAVIKKDKGISKYSIDARFGLWKPLSKKITLSKKIIAVIKKDKESLSKKIHTKEITKETITKEIPCAFAKSQNFKTRNEALEKYVIERMSPSVYKFDAKDLRRIIENVSCREFIEAVERFRTFRIERGVSSGGSGIGVFFRNFLANYDRFTTDAGREAAIKQYKRWNGGSMTDVPKAGKFDREIKRSEELNRMIAELGKGGDNE